MGSIYGGYKTQSVIQISNILSAFDAKKISLKALKLYLGCLVIVSVREAAKRSNSRDRSREGVQPRFLLKELSKLTGYPLIRIRGELRALAEAKILTFSESQIIFTETPLPDSHELKELLSGGRPAARPIPIPRTILRLLSKSSKASMIKTVLGYCVRGLTLSKKGEITGKGSVKATWIANVMGLSERSVRSARSELLDLGWITDDEFSYQRKLNRDGAYFTINLSWKAQNNSAKPVENPILPNSNFAPPRAQNCSKFAPLYKDKKTLNRSKNQKTQPERLNPPGFCNAKTENQTQQRKLPLPNIRDVRLEDLKSFGRVEELYKQAVKHGLIEASEAAAINFIGAAARATQVEGEQPKIFMGIIRKRLWMNITQADEDRALSALRRYRAENPERFRVAA